MNVLFNKKLQKYWIDDERFLVFFFPFLFFFTDIVCVWYCGSGCGCGLKKVVL
jgi:hypothetical protein